VVHIIILSSGRANDCRKSGRLFKIYLMFEGCIDQLQGYIRKNAAFDMKKGPFWPFFHRFAHFIAKQASRYSGTALEAGSGFS
jgi:hypothetical protein